MYDHARYDRLQVVLARARQRVTRRLLHGSERAGHSGLLVHVDPHKALRSGEHIHLWQQNELTRPTTGCTHKELRGSFGSYGMSGSSAYMNDASRSALSA
jgi:hypothetical protein